MPNFEITDHCYVTPSYSDDDDPFTYKDCCAYEGCAQQEIAHLWTVEAFQDNESAVREKEGV